MCRVQVLSTSRNWDSLSVRVLQNCSIGYQCSRISSFGPRRPRFQRLALRSSGARSDILSLVSGRRWKALCRQDACAVSPVCRGPGKAGSGTTPPLSPSENGLETMTVALGWSRREERGVRERRGFRERQRKRERERKREGREGRREGWRDRETEGLRHDSVNLRVVGQIQRGTSRSDVQVTSSASPTLVPKISCRT